MTVLTPPEFVPPPSASEWSLWHRLSLLVPAFCVAIIVLILWIHTDHRINELDELTTTNSQIAGKTWSVAEADQQGTCSLYGFFLGSYSDQTRDAYPAGPVAYDAAIKAIVIAAGHANCGLHAPTGLS